MVAANSRRTRRPYKWSICVGSWRASTIIVAIYEAKNNPERNKLLIYLLLDNSLDCFFGGQTVPTPEADCFFGGDRLSRHRRLTVSSGDRLSRHRRLTVSSGDRLSRHRRQTISSGDRLSRHRRLTVSPWVRYSKPIIFLKTCLLRMIKGG
jgi:hypothetical protein